MDEAKITVLSICVISTVLLVGLVSGTTGQDGGIKECAACHTAGQPGVSAIDTIQKSACYQCHRDDVDFSVTISAQVHVYHTGNSSVLPPLDYRGRHKNNTPNCSDCHSYSDGGTQDCRRCHVSGNHIEKAKDKDCTACHGPVGNLFRHPSIKLVTHDIFGDKSCNMCHSPDKMSLQLANGVSVPISAPSGLCKQCHSGVYRDWSGNKHHSKEECTACHNPHSPVNSSG